MDFGYTEPMRLTWDEYKNQTNIAKHGLDFADAHSVFDHPLLVKLDDRMEYNEERWIGIGLLETRIVVIVFSEPEEDMVRVISLRKATSSERKRYEQAYQDELGSG